MNKKDLGVVAVGLIIASIGVVAALLGYVDFAILALLFFNVVLLMMIILQRRQLGTLQKRTLDLLRARVKIESKSQTEQPEITRKQAALVTQISTKKILGVLHAQQIQLDGLSRSLSTLLDKNNS